MRLRLQEARWEEFVQNKSTEFHHCSITVGSGRCKVAQCFLLLRVPGPRTPNSFSKLL